MGNLVKPFILQQKQVIEGVGGKVHRSPENPVERHCSIQSLPNQSKSLEITKNIRI